MLAAWVPAAAADSCRVMTVRYDLSRDGLVVLDPSHYDIAYGGCVQFVNQTAATATISVGGRYRQQLGPNENTSGATNFKGVTAGRQPVTATSGAAGTAHGSITVAARPAQPPQSSSPKPHPRPSHTSTPAPPPSPATSSASGPQVAPTPHHTRPRHQRSAGLQPPVTPPGPVQTQTPTPTPAPATTPVVAGPIEPASGRGAGLPAALAALAVVGSGAAFVRVLAAEPVDDRETVAGRP
jgi:hypothetical protein